jgi:hypothetical protein
VGFTSIVTASWVVEVEDDLLQEVIKNVKPIKSIVFILVIIEFKYVD